MTFCETADRIGGGRRARKSAGATLLILLAICAASPLLAYAQASGAPSPVATAPLTTQQVVENMVAMNRARAHALLAYHGSRVYRVEYKGFPSNRRAEMVVNVSYRAPGTKVFSVESASGSKLIIDRVLKKLLEAEEEAQTADAQRRTALNSENYDFKMAAYESTPKGPVYVLSVEPKTKEKFLYRGRVWVSAEDFAVMRLEGEPARNPSFWIRDSQIEQVYGKVHDFWLPARNRSVTTIRLGGRAELTIDYQDYQITAADAVVKIPLEEPAHRADAAALQRPGDQR